MKNEEQLIKKKKKPGSRFAKFIVILIILIIIISLVFYSIENPSFLSKIIERLRSFYTGPEETAETVPEEGQAGTTTEESPETESGATEESVIPGDTENTTGSLTFWQKILDFFKKKIESDGNDFPSNLKLKVYFASPGEEIKFSYEIRTIIAQDPEIAVKNAVNELLRGPVKSYNYPVIPPGTELRGVEIYQNLAKIDFSQEFLENSLESGVLDEYVIYTIVNTVTQVPEIEGVIFLIEGKRIKVYGNIDLSIPAIRDESYLGEDISGEDYME